MLFKNNQKWSLNDKANEKEREKLMEVVGSFPVRFELGEGAFTQNPNPENPKRVDRPEVIVIPYSELVNDHKAGEAVTWNYTDLPPATDKQTGMLDFYKNSDGGLKFTGSFTVDKGREDLAYFLIFISKMSAHNPESKRKLIQVDNRAVKATQLINSQKNRVTVEGLIYGQNMLDYAEISRIAKAMGMTGIDQLEDEALVRVALMQLIKSREETETDGYKTFLELSENAYRKETLEAVTKAIDYELAVYNKGIAKWILHNSKGEKTEELCRIVVGKTVNDSLQHHAVTNDKLAATLKAAVLAYEEEKGIREKVA
jgi:hypothetical protein